MPIKDKLQQDIDKYQNEIKSYRERRMWDKLQRSYIAQYNLTVARKSIVLNYTSTADTDPIPPTDPRLGSNATISPLERLMAERRTVPPRRHPMD